MKFEIPSLPSKDSFSCLNLDIQVMKNILIFLLTELERINLIVSEFLILAKPTDIVFKEKKI
ncbi:hypothetical protein GCM10020331_081720 [Ectobacillus funiculus]